jgi:hypothetical protein
VMQSGQILLHRGKRQAQGGAQIVQQTGQTDTDARPPSAWPLKSSFGLRQRAHLGQKRLMIRCSITSMGGGGDSSSTWRL